VATVDPEDDTIRRYVVRHYAYDPDRRERRHITVVAFDNEAEFLALIERLAADLRARRGEGEEVDQREHYSGVVLDAGNRRLQQNGRLIRHAIARGVRVDRLLEEMELPPSMAVAFRQTDDANPVDNS
jgi:hypothetical protein